jgi:hypothetical protein
MDFAQPAASSSAPVTPTGLEAVFSCSSSNSSSYADHSTTGSSSRSMRLSSAAGRLTPLDRSCYSSATPSPMASPSSRAVAAAVSQLGFEGSSASQTSGQVGGGRSKLLLRVCAEGCLAGAAIC